MWYTKNQVKECGVRKLEGKTTLIVTTLIPHDEETILSSVDRYINLLWYNSTNRLKECSGVPTTTIKIIPIITGLLCNSRHGTRHGIGYIIMWPVPGLLSPVLP